MKGYSAGDIASDISETKSEISDFKQIKPEEDISVNEAKSFWNELFCSDNLDMDEILNEQENPHQDVIDCETYYYDDNGDLYRIGNELQPNCQYEINGYTYKTDELGRIVSVEGRLHMKDREGRLPIKDSIEDIGKGDQKEGDDRGHLVGDQFDGSNGLENMVPQDANINRNDFKNFENELAKEVKDGKDVKVKVEPVYEGDSRRPSAIVVTYSIDGEENVRIFPNSQEETSYEKSSIN